jgi:hypothetical protein
VNSKKKKTDKKARVNSKTHSKLFYILIALIIFILAIIVIFYLQKQYTAKEEGIKCDEGSRTTPEYCTKIYSPVCGWFNQNIKCFKYPCAQTYSNACIACIDQKVERWTKGECPK